MFSKSFCKFLGVKDNQLLMLDINSENEPKNSMLLLFIRSVVANSFATPWTVARQAPFHGIS